MKLFPSENEKTITIAIFSFVIALIIGLLAGFEISKPDIFINSFTTLLAAFLGAWFAYKLQDNTKKRKEKKEILKRANNLMFCLFQKLNALKIYQIDNINAVREHPGRMFAIQPTLAFSLPQAEINPDDINFLMHTKYRQLMFDAHLEQQRFDVAEEVIKFRSDMHINVIQPMLHDAGIVEGVETDAQEFFNAIGELNYKKLERITEQLIYSVDKAINTSTILKDNLYKAFTDLYPNEQFIYFELLDEPLNKATHDHA